MVHGWFVKREVPARADFTCFRVEDPHSDSIFGEPEVEPPPSLDAAKKVLRPRKLVFGRFAICGDRFITIAPEGTQMSEVWLLVREKGPWCNFVQEPCTLGSPPSPSCAESGVMVHAAQSILVSAKNGFGHFPENIDADYVADMLCAASSLARGVHVFRFRNEARAREAVV